MIYEFYLNGSGKTTLLEILSLLSPPTTGRIRYNDRDVVFTENNLTPLRREIIMVQQNPVLFTTTVFKNLEFGLKIRGITRREREKIYENIFSGKIARDEDENRVCWIQNKIRLVVETDKTGGARLSIDPRKIEIMKDRDIQVGKNIFKGRLIQLSHERII